MLNRIFIQGRLTKDPDYRATNSGTSVASFTLACNSDYDKDQCDFIECVAWKNTADFVNHYFSKGKLALVEGRLRIEEWTDKDNNKRKSAKVVVDRIYFGESKRADDEPRREANDNKAKVSDPYDFTDISSDDIPF